MLLSAVLVATLATVSSWSSLVWSSWATWSSVLVVGSLSHGSLWLLLLHEHWHALDEKLEVVLELFLVGKVGPLGGLGVLLAELLESTLVLGGLVLQLADLLDLVVVDGKGLVLHHGVVELLLGGGSLIWLLEAHESVEFLVSVGWVESQALNLSIHFELCLQVSLGDVLWETFNVEIASLLGVLVFDGVSQAFSLAVALLKSFFDVQFLVGEWDAVHLVGVVELKDGSLSASWSVLAVILVLGVVADKGVGALVVGLEAQALDSTIFLEKSLHIGFGEFEWEVLGVNVVVDSAEVTLVSWLVLDGLVHIGLRVSLEGLSSSLGVLEAHEAISS